jgi:BirA family biotin operon repressor/biotin-[acetyl-CoA-carboxylase] ligase
MAHAYEPLAHCPSTNDLAASRARAGAPEGLLVVADAQSGGRGRLGRSWHSPAGENLYFSLVLRPERSPSALPPLTLLGGVVLAEAMAALGAAPLVKWPNDVLLPGDGGPLKAAGILTEMATERDRIRHVVLGVGVNVNGVAFPPELADRATSLRLATGRTHDRGALLAAVMNALEPAYERLMREGAGPMLERWRAHAHLPRPCRVRREDEVIEGTALDVDEDGRLLVRDGAGRTHRVLSGEISER